MNDDVVTETFEVEVRPAGGWIDWPGLVEIFTPYATDDLSEDREEYRYGK